MIRSRELLVVVALLAALGLTLGTSSVSSVSADRDIDVSVTNDERAFLAFEQQPANTTNGTTSLNVTVGNQYPEETTLSSVTVSVAGTDVDLTRNQSFTPGTERTASFESVSCADQITVEAEGPGVSTSFERSVSCGR